MKDTDRFNSVRERIGNYLAERLEEEEEEWRSKRARMEDGVQDPEVEVHMRGESIEDSTKEDAAMQEPSSGSGLSDEERKRSAEVETDEGPASNKLMTGTVDEESEEEEDMGRDEEFESLIVE